MQRLLYVRHGETEMNVIGVISGRSDTSLTGNGRRQATDTGKELAKHEPHIDLIITSPNETTFETAKLIAKEIGYPDYQIQKNDLFIERSFGFLEGTLAMDFLNKHNYRDFDTAPGAETIENLDKRAAIAFEYLQTLPQETILVVGPGAFGRALRRVVNHEPYTQEYAVNAPIDNAAIIHLI